MAKDLNGVVVQDHYNGIGLHDSPGASIAAWGYPESSAHAWLLREHGVTLYKILADGANKPERCRAYIDNGILPIVRPYIDHPWGRGLPVTPGDQLKPYIDAGVRLIELGNEWNIACEWKDNRIPSDARVIAQEVCNWWQVCLSRANEIPGLIPLFPSNTPGGNVDHRWCYREIIAELGRRGLLGTVKHIAVHPRPHNNPPDVRWSQDNTVTFDEWRWIRDQFKAAGVNAYYWATEHGYSVGDSQNANYPRIDLAHWLEYNQKLQLWMNGVIEPELAGHMHWYEAGWGHWGAWPKDALVDSIVPLEMPAPSPLWIAMPSMPLNFSRYGDDPAPPPFNPPPVEDMAKGFYLCEYQGDVDLQAAWDMGYRYALIRTSSGLHKDPMFETFWQRCGEIGFRRAPWHYLSLTDAGQSGFAASVLGDRVPEIPIMFVDLEAETTREKAEQWFGAFSRNFPGLTPGYYSSAGWLNSYGVDGEWEARGYELWLASWTDADKPVFPSGVTRWRFWQHGCVEPFGPFPRRVCLDRFAGTVQDLHDLYGGTEPVTGVRYFWYDGTEVDEAQFRAEFGNFVIERVPGAQYQVIRLKAATGYATFRMRIWNEDWTPAIQERMRYSWPDGSVTHEVKDDGWSDHPMGTGEYYWPDQGQIGPAWVQVDGVGKSDIVRGVGMIGDTNHDHFEVVVKSVSEPTYSLDIYTIGEGYVMATPVGPYEPGALVTLTAIPADGWRFVDWSGSWGGSDNPTALIMDSDKSVTATFEPVTDPCPRQEILEEMEHIDVLLAEIANSVRVVRELVE